ncbi:NmrA domain-containing protein [Mycena chlorophos]|uniref:NmrA domain-containing protein n=1 Tax=Mycena chlorophos TaxID=658473 RepID=A0A8H6TQA0_MYCCL|nr:NmrA domain-containing protein [Mycena chlorophos]
MTITKDSSAPLVAVVGATGAQGGSVVDALAESDKAYRIRAFTRDATKPAAEALKGKGAEVVQVALTVENKDKVADYAFLGTNFWEHVNMEKEISEGKLLIDAAKAAGARGIIWSLHQAVVTEYGNQSGVPLVNICAGFYAQNLSGAHGLISKRDDGAHEISWNVRPETMVPLIDIEKDYGMFVRKAIEAKVFPNGQDVNTTSEDISVGDLVKQLSEGTGKTVVYTQITSEEWIKRQLAAGVPQFIAEELVEGFEAFEAVGYYPQQPSATAEGLARPLQTWKQYVKRADWSKALA